MTTLPNISNKTKDDSEVSVKSGGGRLSNIRSKRFKTWKDRENAKRQEIRQEKPIINKQDTSIYRNSYMHNLCIAMLRSGFHKSFIELFNLIDKRDKERLESGPDSIFWQEKSLKTQSSKLDTIWHYLTKAEASLRNGKWEDVYSCRHKLAEYFLSTGDSWLSDHFFQTALDTSLNIRLDGRKREAEAHCNIGLSYERNKNYALASRHMEEFHQLSYGRNWLDENSLTHNKAACRHLSRIYTSLSESQTDISESQHLLHLAYNMAKEGGDSAQEARAALLLGLNYEKSHQSESAIDYLYRCLEVAQDIEDKSLVGETCKALARSHQTQGNITKSIEYLELFAETSRQSDQKYELVEACNCLGTIYNTLGHYSSSVEHFSVAYGITNEGDQTNQESGIQLGIARGNHLLRAFQKNMSIKKNLMMDRIISWKDERIDDLGKPVNQHSKLPSTSEGETIPDPTEPFRRFPSRNDSRESD